MITDYIIDFLNEHTEMVGLPTVMLDMIATGDSISLQTISQPTVERSYINGSTVKRYSFRLTRKGKANTSSALSSLEIIKSLDVMAALFAGMNDFPLNEGITIESADVSTTSILATDDSGMVIYGVTVNLLYKEK